MLGQVPGGRGNGMGGNSPEIPGSGFQVEVVQQGAVRAISVGNDSFTRRGERTDFLSLANDFCERR